MTQYLDTGNTIEIKGDSKWDKNPILYCQNPNCQTQIEDKNLLLIGKKIYHNISTCYNGQFEDISQVNSTTQEKIFEKINNGEKVKFKSKKKGLGEILSA